MIDNQQLNQAQASKLTSLITKKISQAAGQAKQVLVVSHSSHCPGNLSPSASIDYSTPSELLKQSAPGKSKTYSLVVAYEVLHTTDQPEQLISKLIAHLRQQGKIIITAPNYGAPLRSSPNYQGNWLIRAYSGINKDLWHYLGIKKTKSLGWYKYEPDQRNSDSQIASEPYLISLLSYLRHHGILIKDHTTFIQSSERKSDIITKSVKLIGKLDLYPCKYWGAHIYLSGQLSSTKQARLSSTFNTVIHWIKVVVLLILIILPATPILIAIWIILQKLISLTILAIKQLKT